MCALPSRDQVYSVSRNALLKCIAATALSVSLAANAGSISVAPLRLIYTSGTVIAAITVENSGREEALVQTETFAWTQLNGEHKLAPTDDVVAVPPVFRLAPGQKQLVRVGLTRAFTEVQEQTFRLTVTEVPTAVKPGTVAVAVRHSLPIFVQPASPLSSKLAVNRGATNTLAIANNGGQHIHIHGWRLRDNSGAVVVEESGPGYLLAGTHLAIAIAGARVAGPLTFEADSSGGTTKIAVAE